MHHQVYEAKTMRTYLVSESDSDAGGARMRTSIPELPDDDDDDVGCDADDTRKSIPGERCSELRDRMAGASRSRSPTVTREFEMRGDGVGDRQVFEEEDLRELAMAVGDARPVLLVVELLWDSEAELAVLVVLCERLERLSELDAEYDGALENC